MSNTFIVKLCFSFTDSENVTVHMIVLFSFKYSNCTTYDWCCFYQFFLEYDKSFLNRRFTSTLFQATFLLFLFIFLFAFFLFSSSENSVMYVW